MKLSKEEKAKHEVQKVIRASEVEQHTSEGWTILESFEMEETYPCHESIAPVFPIHVHVEGDQYSIGNSIAQGLSGKMLDQVRYEKVKQIIFLVGKTKDSILSEKQTKIHELEAKINDAEQHAKELADAKKVQEEELFRERDSRRDQYDRAERNAKDRETYRERLRKIELDIGKIRKAIGEDKMNEITKEE